MSTSDRPDQPPRQMRCLVITLSDRAAAGVYADRSGPRMRELLHDYFTVQAIEAQIESRLLPDDAAMLREEIAAACQRGVDVILTTGGTGVGPRDIAPDTVAALCDKLIPGIMEHIRAKFGAVNPRARLSRAIAGVIVKTQIYTLPGSLRAVEEYLPEIMVTLTHIADTLQGLDTH